MPFILIWISQKKKKSNIGTTIKAQKILIERLCLLKLLSSEKQTYQSILKGNQVEIVDIK